eukprot:Hpha_TRINITY_DN13937_c0_g1::TRINITY_DN13937_c0_g1_i1::g.35709::m.35709/K07390/grxD, GLRX5; monothiol glutaredoxin
MMRSVLRVAPRMASRSALCRAPAAFPALTPVMTRRWSHPDFGPTSTDGPSQDEKTAIMEEMKTDIKSIPCILFMKGEPESPRCGFSSRTVELLKAYGIAFTSYNVLAHPAVREGVKEISGWPTIPQFFVKGEFVGGCDLLMEMHQSGDLPDLFKNNGITFRDPKTGDVHSGATQGLDGQ